MERTRLEPAFVVHQRPYRETSAILELLTRDHGRVSAVAKGIKRPRSPLRAVLQPFSALLASWTGRGELVTLVGAESASAAFVLERTALLSGLYVNELVMRLTHRFDPHPGLFDAYSRALTGLAANAQIEDTLRAFEKTLLDEVGYGPVLEHEVGSGAPVEPARRYRYVCQHGPEPVTHVADVERALDVSGRTLLALAGHAAMDSTSRREAKRLLRAEIDALLGTRPLATRRLLRRPAHRASPPDSAGKA